MSRHRDHVVALAEPYGQRVYDADTQVIRGRYADVTRTLRTLRGVSRTFRGGSHSLHHCPVVVTQRFEDVSQTFRILLRICVMAPLPVARRVHTRVAVPGTVQSPPSPRKRPCRVKATRVARAARARKRGVGRRLRNCGARSDAIRVR